MSCKRFSDAITDHACGAPIAADAARHLRSCEACRRTVDEHRRLLADAESVLRSELAVAASPDFVARVSAQTCELGASTKRWTLPAAWWVGAAAAAAIMIGVYVGAPVEKPAPMTLSRGTAPSVHLPAEIATHEAASTTVDSPVPEPPGR
jgi:anti-sigma factor RsiW